MEPFRTLSSKTASHRFNVTRKTQRNGQKRQKGKWQTRVKRKLKWKHRTDLTGGSYVHRELIGRETRVMFGGPQTLKGNLIGWYYITSTNLSYQLLCCLYMRFLRVFTWFPSICMSIIHVGKHKSVLLTHGCIYVSFLAVRFSLYPLSCILPVSPLYVILC